MFRMARVFVIAGAVLWLLPRPAACGGDATFGSQWWDQSAPDAKYREFRDVPRGAFLENFVLNDWSGRSVFRLSGANAMRTDQSTSFGWLMGARARLDLDYSQIPHNFSYTARTPYTEVSPGVFVLPDSLQRTNQDYPGSYAKTMTDLLNAARRTPVGFRTDITKARFKVRPMPGWQLEVHGMQRNRNGTKAWGAPFGFNSAIELLEPINQRMTEADATASYHKNRVSIQASAGLSGFDNKVSTLVWDNPKRITDRTGASLYVGGDGSVAGRMDLYPDNEVVRGGLAASLQLPRYSTLSATVGVSHYTQDDEWLPMTINSAIPQSSLDSLPARSSNAKATRLTGDYRLVTRPDPRFAATLRLHHDRYENDTAERTFSGLVRLDQAFIAGPIANHPADYEQMLYGLDADFDVAKQLRIGGLIEQRRRERTEREIEQDDETAFGGRARIRPGMDVELTVDYRRGERSLDHFDLDEYRKGADPDSVLLEQSTLRRFDLADRKQDMIRSGLSLPVGERLTLAGRYTFLHNEYDNTALGLTDERNQAVNGDLTWSASENFDLSGGFGWERIDTDQNSRESGAVLVASDTTNWGAKLKDKSTYAYLNANWAATGRIRFITSYEFSESMGDFDLRNFKNTAVDLPETKFRRHDVTAEMRWAWMPHTDVALRYGFEQYDVTDYASENVPFVFPVIGASNAIFLGDSSIDYRAHRVALMATHRF